MREEQYPSLGGLGQVITKSKQALRTAIAIFIVGICIFLLTVYRDYTNPETIKAGILIIIPFLFTGIVFLIAEKRQVWKIGREQRRKLKEFIMKKNDEEITAHIEKEYKHFRKVMIVFIILIIIFFIIVFLSYQSKLYT